MAIPAAYGIARTHIRGRTLYLLFLLTAQMLPSVLIVIPLFVLFKPLGLINSYQGVIIADTALALPFAIIILRTSFLQIPLDLEEAALIDGCSRIAALWRIIVPLVRSGVIAVAMFSFLTAWGEFVFALSFLQNVDLQPVSVGIFSFIGMYTTQWGALMAFSVMIALPALIAFLLLQRHFISGLTTGAVK
jgi:multiple sugar transport system permease protein